MATPERDRDPSLTPEEILRLTQDYIAVAKKLAEFNERINSSFQGYIEGNKEVLKLRTLIADIDEKINELGKDGLQVDEEKVKAFQRQKEFFQSLIDSQKEQLKNVNLLRYGYQAIEKSMMGMMTGVLANISDYVIDADKAWRNLNLTLGLSGDRSYMFRQNLIDASKQAALLGVSFEELTQIQGKYSEQTGTAVLLTKENLLDIVAIGKGTKMGTAEAAKMAGKFTNIGKSLQSVKTFYQDAVKESTEFGLSVDAVMRRIDEGFDRAQQYVFKGGVRGLKDMAMYSTKFNLSMSSVFNALDKTNTLEGVVDSVSQLQVLGGKFAQVDPFKLLYQSRNDAVGFTKTMQGLTKGMVTFNNVSGDFNQIQAGDLNRLKMASEATGVAYEDLIKTAYKGAQIDMIDGMLGSKSLTPDQKSFIENVAQLKDGKFQVQVAPGQYQDIKNLTAQQIEGLRKANASLEQNAQAALAFDDTFKSILNSFKASLLPVLMPLANGLKMLVESDLGKWSVGLVTGAVLLGGAAGFIAKSVAGLKYIIPGLSNLKLPSLLDKLKIGGKPSAAVPNPGNAAEGTGELAKNMEGAGNAAGAAWKNMLAFGGAVLMIGGGVWLATNGIASMATAFANLKPEQISGVNSALLGLGIGLAVISGVLAALAFSGVGEAAVGLMLAFGGAVLFIGTGIGIASAGLGLMAKGFGDMFESLSKITDPRILSGLSGLVLSLTALGVSSLLFANPLAWVGLAVLTGSVGNLADKVSTLDFSKVTTGADGFNRIADAIERINDKKLDKLIAVAESLGSIGSLAAMFANFSNALSDTIKVEFKDQTIPLTVNITNEIDGQALTRMMSKRIPLAIRSSQKGGSN